MNREIKFRAWDGKQMLWLDQLWWCNEYSSVAWSFKDGGICGFSEEEFDTDKAILMQYTGLTDKNGKEIYEGDILKTGWGALSVYWGRSGWMNCQQAENNEIIGNIYENPDLLKD